MILMVDNHKSWAGVPLHRPYIGLIYGRYLQFRFLKWPLNSTAISTPSTLWKHPKRAIDDPKAPEKWQQGSSRMSLDVIFERGPEPQGTDCEQKGAKGQGE